MFIKTFSSNKYGLRCLCIVITLCMVMSDLHVYAQSALSLSQGAGFSEQAQQLDSRTNGRRFRFEPHSIQLPETFGLIKEVYRGRSENTVILLQDAHGHLSAQQSLANILQHVQTQYGFDAIFLEGGLEGEIANEQLRLFEDDALNRQLANKLLKEAQIGGPSVYLLNHPNQMSVYGMESKELYYRNVLSFRRVYSWKHKTNKFLNQLKARIQTIASQYFNPALQAFSKEWLFYQDDQHDILQHLEILERNAKKHLKISFKDAKQQMDYPHLVRYFHLRELENQMRHPAYRGELELEKEKMLEQIWAFRLPQPPSELIKLVSLAGTQIKKEDIPNQVRYVMESFYEQAYMYGFRWEDFPRLKQYFSSVILGQEIDGYELFTEIESATFLMMERLSETEEEKSILEMYRGYFLLHKLMSLELTREEFLTTKEQINVLNPIDFLARTRAYHDGTVDFKFLEDSQKVFKEAIQFYELAVLREETMLATVVRTIEDQNHKRSLIVSGGFHASGITEGLKENEISYISVLPHIDKLDPNTSYVDQMMLRSKKDPRFARVVQVGADRIPIPEMMSRDRTYQARNLQAAMREVDPTETAAYGPAVQLHQLFDFESPQIPAVAASETRVLPNRTPPHDQYQGLDLGKAQTFVKQAMSNGGRDQYPSLTSEVLNREIPEGERMNTLQNRVDERQALHNMVKNSQDWNYDSFGNLVPIEKHSRVHGEGALGFLGDLQGRKSFAVLESKRKGSRGIRVYFWNVGAKESPKYRFYFEYADDLDFEHGTRHEIHKKLDDVEERVENIRERVSANALSPVKVNDERANPVDSDGLLQNYDYLGKPGGNKVANTSLVSVEINSQGYVVQDSGYGMSDQDFFEKYLVAGINEDEREAVRKAQRRDPRDGKLKASKQVARRTKVEGWVNSHQVSSFSHGGPERLNLIEQLIVDFPAGTTIPNDSSVVMLDNLSRHALRTIIDRLTDPNEKIENRYAKINSLAVYIRLKQSEQELEQLSEQERLLEHLARQVRKLIAKVEVGGLVDGKLLVPNDLEIRGQQVYDHESFIPLDSELFDFEFASLVRNRLSSPSPEVRQQLVGESAVLNSVRIYLTDWPISEQLGGQKATWLLDDDGLPVILIDGTTISDQDQSIATLSMMLGMWAKDLGKILQDKGERITPVRKKKVKQKRGLLDSLYRFRKWIGGTLLALLSLPIFQGLVDKYMQWKVENEQRKARAAAILEDSGFEAQKIEKDEQSPADVKRDEERLRIGDSRVARRRDPSEQKRWETFKRAIKKRPPKASEVQTNRPQRATRIPPRKPPETRRQVFRTPNTWRPQNTSPQVTQPQSERDQSSMNLPNRTVTRSYSPITGSGRAGGGLAINHASPFDRKISERAMSRPLPKTPPGSSRGGSQSGGSSLGGGAGQAQQDPVYGYVVNPQMTLGGTPEPVIISVYSGLSVDGAWVHHDGYEKWPKEGATPIETKPISIRMWGDVSPGKFYLYNYHSGIVRNIRVRVVDRETGAVKGNATGWERDGRSDVITFEEGSKSDEIYAIVYDVDYYDPADLEDNLGFRALPEKEKRDFDKYFGHLFVGWEEMSEEEQIESAVNFAHTVAAYDEYANIEHGALALAGRNTWSLAMFESLLVEGRVTGATPQQAIETALSKGNEIDLICNNACVVAALTLGQNDAFTVAYASGVHPTKNGALSMETVGHAVSLIKSNRLGSHRRVLDLTKYLNVNETVVPRPARRPEAAPAGDGLASSRVRATQAASDAFRVLIEKLESLKERDEFDEVEVLRMINALNDIWADNWVGSNTLKDLYAFLRKLKGDPVLSSEISEVLVRVEIYSWRLKSLMATGHLQTDEEVEKAQEEQREENIQQTLKLFEEVRITGALEEETVLAAIKAFSQLEGLSSGRPTKLEVYRLIQFLEELMNYPQFSLRARQSYDQLMHQNYAFSSIQKTRAIGELIDNLGALVEKGALSAEEADSVHGWLMGRWERDLDQAEQDALKAWIEILSSDDQYGAQIEEGSEWILGEPLEKLRSLQGMWDLADRLREIQAEGQLPAEDLQLLIDILDKWKWNGTYQVFDSDSKQWVEFDSATVLEILKGFINRGVHEEEFYEYLNYAAMKFRSMRELWAVEPTLYNVPLLVQKIVETLEGVIPEEEVRRQLDLLFDSGSEDRGSFTEALELHYELHQLNQGDNNQERVVEVLEEAVAKINQARQKWVIRELLVEIKSEGTLPEAAMDAIIQIWTDRINNEETQHYTYEQIYTILRRFISLGQHTDIFYVILDDYAQRHAVMRDQWSATAQPEDMPFVIDQIVLSLEGSVDENEIRESLNELLEVSNQDKSSLQQILDLKNRVQHEDSYGDPAKQYERFANDLEEQVENRQLLSRLKAIQAEGTSPAEPLEEVVGFVGKLVRGEIDYLDRNDERKVAFAALRELTLGENHRNDFYEVLDSLSSNTLMGTGLWKENGVAEDIPFVTRKIIDELEGIASQEEVLDYVERLRDNRGDDQKSIENLLYLRFELEKWAEAKSKAEAFQESQEALSRLEWDAFREWTAPYVGVGLFTALGLVLLFSTYMGTKKAIEEENEEKRGKKIYPGHRGPKDRIIEQPIVPGPRHPDDEVTDAEAYAVIHSPDDSALPTLGTFYQLGAEGNWEEVDSSHRISEFHQSDDRIVVKVKQEVREDRTVELIGYMDTAAPVSLITAYPADKNGKYDKDGYAVTYFHPEPNGEIFVSIQGGKPYRTKLKDGRIVLPEGFPSNHVVVSYRLTITEPQDLAYYTRKLSSLPEEERADFQQYFDRELGPHLDKDDHGKLEALDRFMRNHVVLDESLTEDSPNVFVREEHHTSWAHAAHERIHKRGRKIYVNSQLLVFFKALVASYLGMPVMRIVQIEPEGRRPHGRWDVHTGHNEREQLLIGVKVQKGDEPSAKSETRSTGESEQELTPEQEHQQAVIDTVNELKNNNRIPISKGVVSEEGPPGVVWVADVSELHVNPGKPSLGEIARRVFMHNFIPALTWSLHLFWSIITLKWAIEIARRIKMYRIEGTKYRRNVEAMKTVFSQLGVPAESGARTVVEQYPRLIRKENRREIFFGREPTYGFIYLDALSPNRVLMPANFALLGRLHDFHRSQGEDGEFAFFNGLFQVRRGRDQTLLNLETGWVRAPTLGLSALKQDNFVPRGNDVTSLSRMLGRSSVDRLLGTAGYDLTEISSFKMVEPVTSFTPIDLYVETHLPLTEEAQTYGEQLISLAIDQNRLDELQKVFGLVDEIHSRDERYLGEYYQRERIEDPRSMTMRLLRQAFFELRDNQTLEGTLDLVDYLLSSPQLTRDERVQENVRRDIERQRIGQLSRFTNNNDPHLERVFPYPQRELVEDLLGRDSLREEEDDNATLDSDLELQSSLLDEPQIQARFRRQNPSLAWVIDAAREVAKREKEQEQRGEQPQPLTYEAFLDAMIAVTQERGDPRSKGEMLLAIENQSQPGMVMIRELIQNARDVTRDVPNHKVATELKRFKGKRQVRVRSFLNNKHPDGRLRHTMSVEDNVGMLPDILVKVFFPPKATTKSPDKVIGKILSLPMEDVDKVDLIFKGLVLPSRQGDEGLRGEVEGIVRAPRGEDTVDNILLTLEDAIDPEKKKAGQFGVGNYTVHQHSDEVVVRTGYGGQVYLVKMEVKRSTRVNKEGEEETFIDDVEIQDFKVYNDPKEQYKGTLVQSIRIVEGRDRAQVEHEDRYLKYLFAKYIGAVTDVDIVFVNAAGETREGISVKDKRDVINRHGAVETRTSELKISRVTVDELYIQDPGDDGVLFAGVPAWGRAWIKKVHLNFEYRRGTSVKEARAGIRYAKELSPDTAAASLKTFVTSYRQGGIKIPGLQENVHSEFIQDPNTFFLPGLWDNNIRADAAKINRGENLTPQRWQYYMRDDTADVTGRRYTAEQKYAALLLRVQVPMKDGVARSVMEEKNNYFFKHVPPWIRQQFFVNNLFRDQFSERAHTRAWSIDSETSPIRTAQVLFETAARLYAEGNLTNTEDHAGGFPGHPYSFEAYLSSEVPAVVPRPEVDEELGKITAGINFEPILASEQDVASYLLELAINKGSSINDIKESHANSAQSNIEDAISQATNVYLVRPDQSPLIRAFDSFLTAVTTALGEHIPSDEHERFRFQTEWNFSEDDASALDAFADFLASGDQSILTHVLNRMARGSVQGLSDIFFSAIVNAQSNGALNFVELQQSLNSGQDWAGERQSLDELIQVQSRENLEVHFVHGRSETRTPTELEVVEASPAEDVSITQEVVETAEPEGAVRPKPPEETEIVQIPISFETQLDVARAIQNIMSLQIKSETRQELFNALWPDRLANLQLSDKAIRLQNAIATSEQPISIVSVVPQILSETEMDQYVTGVLTALLQNNLTHEVLTVVRGPDRAFRRLFEKAWAVKVSTLGLAQSESRRFLRHAPVMSDNRASLLGAALLSGRQVVLVGPANYAWDLESEGISYDRVFTDQLPDGSSVGLSADDSNKLLGSLVTSALETVLLEPELLSNRTRLLVEARDQLWYVESREAILSFAGELDALFETIRAVRQAA